MASMASFFLLLCLGLVCAWDPSTVFKQEDIVPQQLKQEVVDMFMHGWNCYKNHAGFESDELMCLSCKGNTKMGGLSTTLIDSLDMLAVLGMADEFTAAVDWVAQHVSFDKDVNVSVFETNIRILGGLLSAHVIAMNKTLGMYRGDYDGSLLRLAADLGDRFVPAFQTPTGLPYGTVNLRNGVPPGETKAVCAACAGTFALEFGTLSLLTGNPLYERLARQAAEVLWSKRSPRNLLSTHLDVDTGKWVIQGTCGLGGDTDSAYEYFWKAGVAFEDDRYKEIFQTSYEAIRSTLKVEGDGYLHFVDSDLTTGVKLLNVRSLAAFWPGVLACMGDLEAANRSIHSFGEIQRVFGFVPESVDLAVLPIGPKVVSGLGAEPFHRGVLIDGYPLRPELVESIYHLYSITRDESLLKVALQSMQALRTTRVPCGYCSVHGVLALQHRLNDQMDSFFLTETLKYLYLLWDLAAASGSVEKLNWVNRGGYIFTTEAHVLPLFKRSVMEILLNITAAPEKQEKGEVQPEGSTAAAVVPTPVEVKPAAAVDGQEKLTPETKLKEVEAQKVDNVVVEVAENAKTQVDESHKNDEL